MKNKETALRATVNLYELMQEIQKTEDPATKNFLLSLADALEAEIIDWYYQLKEDGFLTEMTVGQLVEAVKPMVEILRKYEALKNTNNDPEEGEQLSFDLPIPQRSTELPTEIQELLNIAESDNAMLDDNPFLKSITRRNNSIANYGEAGQIRIIDKSGGLNPFHAEVFNTAIKAYRNHKVTKDGYIVITENQAIKIMLGTSGTPSEKQKEDFRQAWEDMRNESMTYETTESLAEILGIEKEELEEFIPGIKENKSNVVEEYFVQGLKVIKRQTVNGKDTDIYLIKPSDIVKKCLDEFAWYEEIEPITQRVLKEDDNGNLKIWGYSKQRVKMRQYIYSWVYKCKRARANDRNISLKMPYEQIFAECGLDISHRQERARRIDDTNVLLEHLKRCGEIADWKQYKDKAGTLKGVSIRLYKERLI